MASLSSIHTLPLPRWHSNWSVFCPLTFVQIQDFRLQKKWGLRAVSKKKVTGSVVQDASSEEGASLRKASKTSKQPSKRGRKKATSETPEENPVSAMVIDVAQEESTTPSASSEDSKKTPKRTRKKVASTPTSLEGENKDKKVGRGRKTKKVIDNTEDQVSEAEISDNEGPTFAENVENEEEEDLELGKYEEDDISFTYGWPPLVCCFGAAQHAFVPSGRPANRLIDHEIHERMKDALWAPKIYVRAPGSSSSSVAVALASLGGKVAFMGKLGDDEYGQTLLYYLNMNNVQTRSVSVDSKKLSAVSHMKIGRRGGLRMTCVKPCAEDSLSRAEINIDVLKEAKMFYFNSSSLLDRNMRSTTLLAIKISKKLGGVIFFDVNLPLPLWHSSEETKMFIQQAWNLADIIEITKQELEFLCGINPSENFDTKDNDKSKFIHYKPEVVTPLWHENLKVLFVTNGTSKIHFYTERHNGSVNGMEDAPLTPFTCDMSASGDGIVAALMRMLTVQPHLVTDPGYLQRTVKYAINCGVIDQWMLARTRGFPPKEDMEELISDPNGIRSITEIKYRTLEPVS
ncbi:hypothetical protein HHK36_007377 [Tetracentron sinense]|uniref:Carbohydrate kinase PfkB domain-containing protein n=1 Tax=Tetracentron sinense TaxID=13715 RepID=A0A834ZTF3_TETSI|nr:hypothetical protein HHK36_007377 [Tetracentron sinense]